MRSQRERDGKKKKKMIHKKGRKKRRLRHSFYSV
jgi:hypothetical protein